MVGRSGPIGTWPLLILTSIWLTDIASTRIQRDAGADRRFGNIGQLEILRAAECSEAQGDLHPTPRPETISDRARSAVWVFPSDGRSTAKGDVVFTNGDGHQYSANMADFQKPDPKNYKLGSEFMRATIHLKLAMSMGRSCLFEGKVNPPPKPKVLDRRAQ